MLLLTTLKTEAQLLQTTIAASQSALNMINATIAQLEMAQAAEANISGWDALPLVLTTTEAAQAAGVAMSTLNDWLKLPDFPAHKQGGRWLIDRDLFRKWLIGRGSESKPASKAGPTVVSSVKPVKRPGARKKRNAETEAANR